ncbi:MAG TPA: TonB family protein [Pyrinomonadaceae bacterium]|nr:TonB family protein [Pyrinomonadaceae bacterium]
MTSLFSHAAIEKLGIERVHSNNQGFSRLVRKSFEAGGKPKMNDIKVTSAGNTARVSFVYRDQERNDSMGLGFDLSKEDGAWKIDNIGGRDAMDLSEVSSPSPVESPDEASAPFAPVPEASHEKPAPPSAPVSGGVLNAKAISLPKPPTPPIAKAAKASGTVVIQVLVDENGSVVSAHAVSGHPLLQAAAVAAARSAKFSPTKLSGQPVKVTGVITYQFEPQ